MTNFLEKKTHYFDFWVLRADGVVARYNRIRTHQQNRIEIMYRWRLAVRDAMPSVFSLRLISNERAVF